MTDQADSAASSTMLAYQADLDGPGRPVGSRRPAANPGLTAAIAQSRKGSEKKASDAPCTSLIQRFS